MNAWTEQRPILILAAHPDHEALGCGGTIARATEAGATVRTLFFTCGVGSRRRAGAEVDGPQRRAAAAAVSLACLGAEAPQILEYPDTRLSTVPLLALSRPVDAQW